eukprot:4185890-Prymnesium_polylepis.1
MPRAASVLDQLRRSAKLTTADLLSPRQKVDDHRRVPWSIDHVAGGRVGQDAARLVPRDAKFVVKVALEPRRSRLLLGSEGRGTRSGRV